MTVDSMARLAAANPVPDPPAVQGPERLRRLIACPHTGEDDVCVPDPGERRHGSPPAVMGRPPALVGSRMRRRALVALPICVAASVLGVVLTSDPSGPGVNVAAAAYAAISPRSGIVEAVFVTHIERGVQAGSVLRQREWDDAGKGLRRERVTFTEAFAGKRETHISESASAPGRRETWYRGHLEVSKVPRSKAAPDLKLRMAFGGVPQNGVEAIELYRALYREGLMRLVGRERHDGQSLWKLESASISIGAKGRQISVPRLVVLVDPNTFLPVVERRIGAALAGHPIVLESNLLSYRHLPSGQSSAKLFDVAAHHPPHVPRAAKPSTLPRLGSPHGPH
jgi:hypothetical protein